MSRGPEADLSRAVQRFLRLVGCRVWSTEVGYLPGRRGGTRTTAGVPDLLVFHPATKRFCFAELKAPRGRTTKHQTAFLDTARDCGLDAFVWRSVDDALKWVNAPVMEGGGGST